MAKVEWHPNELYPRVGFIVTNLARPAERVVALYNQRGTCEQFIKEGKGAIKWTRLSCRTFAANAVPPPASCPSVQSRAFHADVGAAQSGGAVVADQLAREADQDRIAKVVSHSRYVTFQLAEVAVSRQMFADILSLIAQLRAPPAPA